MVAALAAYNAGPGNVDKWGGSDLELEDIRFPETRAYVEEVLDKQARIPRQVRAGAGLLSTEAHRDRASRRWRSPSASSWPTPRSSSWPCPRSTASSTPASPRVTWVLVSFNLVMALAAVPAAHLARRVGPGRAAAVGLAIFAGAGLACGVSTELSTLIAARCVQALGGAAAVTAVLELLPATVGSERRAAVIWATAGATGAALGPAVGGILTELVSWQSIFLLQVPIAIAAAVPILAVARHEAATGIALDRAAPDRPAAPARQPGAGAGLGGDRRRPLPPRPAPDRRLAPERRSAPRSWSRVMPLAALARQPPRRAPCRAPGRAPRPARSSSPAASAAWRCCPRRRSLLTIPPQILVGVGLSLVLSALTETALSGRAPQAIHGGWTISARHAGVVIGLLALTPIFTHDIAQQRNDAINAGTAVVLDSKVSPLLKIQLAQRIDERLQEREGQGADPRARSSNRCPKIPPTAKPWSTCAKNSRTSSTAARPMPSAPPSRSAP